MNDRNAGFLGNCPYETNTRPAGLAYFKHYACATCGPGAFTLNRILQGGLVQRIIDSFYLGWFFLVSLRLVQIGRTVE